MERIIPNKFGRDLTIREVSELEKDTIWYGGEIVMEVGIRTVTTMRRNSDDEEIMKIFRYNMKKVEELILECNGYNEVSQGEEDYEGLSRHYDRIMEAIRT